MGSRSAITSHSEAVKSTQAAFGKWKNFAKATTATSRVLKLAKAGTTECFKARARDFAGNVGDYGAPACTTYPLDDRNLKHQGTWTKTKDPADYRGTAMTSTTAGATLSATGYFADASVIATTCPTCGILQVLIGGSLVTTINLASPFTQTGTFAIPLGGGTQHNTITLKQASAGSAVTIDGLILTLL